MNFALYLGLLLTIIMLFLLFTLVATWIFVCIDNYLTDLEEKKGDKK